MKAPSGTFHPAVASNMPEKAPPDDQRLIAACLQGQTEAYGMLVRRHQDRLFGALFRFLGNSEDALDVAQEAFLSAYSALADFKGGARFYTWLYRIAMNHAIDLRRRVKKKRTVQRVEEQAPLVPDRKAAPPGERLEQQESAAQLQGALQQLSAEHRVVLVLKDLEGLRYEEIAEIAGVPIGTVRSRLHRARLELKELLAPGAADLDCGAH